MSKTRKSRRTTIVTTLLLDCFLLPLVALAALLLKSVRRMGLHRLRLCRGMLTRVGVLPVRKHYYEPYVDATVLTGPLDADRSLPGIDWNVDEQLALLETFRYADELRVFATPKPKETAFYIHNTQFGPGDAEFLYQLIRATRPRRVVEIGSGQSTLIAREALMRNHEQNGASDPPRHVCIEPYEAPWLERVGVATVRKRVEEVDPAIFQELEANDILFIDSSHMIRPQGDVVTEYLQILPSLKTGVIVHVHDIFSPRDYPRAWVLEVMRLWNEQYLLEAFLTHNHDWKVIGALHYLYHHHFDALRRVCPFLSADRGPGSFYMQKLV